MKFAVLVAAIIIAALLVRHGVAALSRQMREFRVLADRGCVNMTALDAKINELTKRLDRLIIASGAANVRIEQAATDAAALAAGVAEDAVRSHAEADAVDSDAPPGAAADAGAKSPNGASA